MSRDSKNDRRRHRKRETINTKGLKPWQAKDTQPGVIRSLFPTFRVDQSDLNEINDYCKAEGIERSILMRRLIRDFLESLRQD